MAKRRRWTRDELLMVLDVYCRLPFGLFHKGNEDVNRLAKLIDRSPSAVAMKLCNLASLDPAQGGKGLANASKGDVEIWEEFWGRWEELSLAIEEAKRRLSMNDRAKDNAEEDRIFEATEAYGIGKHRLVQSFFRNAVLSSYDFTCCFCGLGIRRLLNASHIVPWSVDEFRRADPRNGLSLCALHDRAFDRGLMSLDGDLRILISQRLREEKSSRLVAVGFLELEGKMISTREKFDVDMGAVEYHRRSIFN